MSTFIPYQETIAKAFAIAGLSLVGLSTYYFRNYSRVLEYVQLFYIFTYAYTPLTILFSNQLYWSFISFMQTFLSGYCQTGEFLCTYGYLISPAIAWFGVALLMLITLSIVGCRKSNVKFQNFYNFWKGLFRWFSVPLTYYCTDQIIKSLQRSNFNATEVSFDTAIIIAVIIFFWMFVELIGYSCVQKAEENTWKKGCDFISNFRIISVVVLVVISLKIDAIAKYFVYGPIVIYDLVFLVKYKFTFKVFERIVFIIQEGVLITCFSLFIFNKQYIYDNNIDIFGLGLVILLELLIFFPKLVSTCKNSQEDQDPIVNPEGRSPLAKKNNFNELSPELSRSNLNESPRVPPRRR